MVPEEVMEKRHIVLDPNDNVTKKTAVSTFLIKTSKHVTEGNACKIPQ